jgi:ketosteroid isomerase-like protein
VRTLPGVEGPIIERYLLALTNHDWDALAECLTDDVVRIGPYGDTYESKESYVSFISDLLPSLPGYVMDITRVTYGDGVGFAELSETVTVGGAPLRTPECLTFELADDGRIRRLEVFTQNWPQVDA